MGVNNRVQFACSTHIVANNVVVIEWLDALFAIGGLAFLLLLVL